MTEYEQAKVDALNRIGAALEKLSERPPMTDQEDRLHELSNAMQIQQLEKELGEKPLFDQEAEDLDKQVNFLQRKRELAGALEGGFISRDNPVVQKYLAELLTQHPELGSGPAIIEPTGPPQP